MAISFPSNPTIGQQYTAAGITWEWNGTSWASLPPSGGGSSGDVVDDTTPQLGGDLDLNGKDITGTGSVNISGVITATDFNGSAISLTGLTGASAGTYGNSTAVPVITVNSVGRISAISTTGVSGGGGGGGINDIVQDSTPQLGGNLDLNGNSIIGVGSILSGNLIGALPALDGSALTGITDFIVGTSLTVTSNASFNNLNITKISEVSGTTLLSGVTTCGSDFNVSGIANLNNLTIPVDNGTFGDNNKILVGNDLRIYSESSYNFIITDEKPLVIGVEVEDGGPVHRSRFGLIEVNPENDRYYGNNSHVAIGYGTEGTKLITTGAGVSISGICSATQFIGDGSLLSNVGSGSTSEWTLGADGNNNYTFSGPGLTGAENDPTLYLVRGQQYRFTNNMGAHAFRIQSTVNGSTGTQYNDGITNNDVSNGTLIWDVQFDAPKILYYQCTAHANMGGVIYIVGENEDSPSYNDVNVSGVLTVSQGRIQANAASNLRFGNIAAGSGSGRNIAIGDQVLGSLSSGSGRNIGVGELSLNNVTSGGYNVGLGIKAGQLLSTGSYNVVIGGYDGNSGNLDIRGLSNRVVISDGQGNIRQYITDDGKVGINTTIVPETLTVSGVVSATSFHGTLPSNQLTGALPALDGSALINVTGSGSGVVVQNNASPVGTAGTINFDQGLDISFSAGIATVTTGINTANINADTLNVTGVSTLSELQVPGGTGASNQIRLGNNQEFTLQYNTSSTRGLLTAAGNPIDIQATTIKLLPNVGANGVIVNQNGSVELYHNNLLKFETTGIGVSVYNDLNVGTDVTINGNTGIVSATSFSGSGANLTNLPAGQLSGTLPAIDGSALLNVNATGDGVVVENNGTNVGSAKTVNFDTGLDVTYSAGIATVTASGGSLQTRTTVSASTTSIADNALGFLSVTGFKSYALMKVGLSTAGWLRIYTDSASRNADSSRSVGEDPLAGSGVIAEVVTTGISTEQKISPFTLGGNMDDPVDTTIYMSITNLSGSTQSIDANLTILQLEA